MKTMKRFIVIIVVLVLGVSKQGLTQMTPGEFTDQKFLILGGTAHLGTGDKIEGAAIGFENGKITFVGSEKSIDRADWDVVVEADGKHVYPGFIAPNSTLGLVEIGAVRATRDSREVGTFKPNVRSVISFNTDSEIIPTVRSNGVLMGQTTPRGGTISGTSSVVHFDAWNWEDAIIREDDGIHLNWPGMYHKHREKGKVDIQLVKSYDQQRREIMTFFSEAKAYHELKEKLTDLKYEALGGMFDGSKTLYVHAHDAKQITEAITFKKDLDIVSMVIVGGYDSWMVADMLRENEVGVMVRRIHQTPRYTADDIDLPFKLPKLLQDEGVLFCLENDGRMSEMGTRNLPFYAGTAVAYGLTYEQGVQSLTLNTAKILGIDDSCGSLEVGKDATVFVSEGDALDMMTNDVNHAWIQGRQVDLDNRQKQLYRKYKQKYDSQQAEK
jgi:imidazolonepropionase-like amidohydrolase